MVNIGENEDVEAEVARINGDVQVFTVTGNSTKAQNEQVGMVEVKWDGKRKYRFCKHYMVMLRWKTE
jgi:hypothetical protein